MAFKNKEIELEYKRKWYRQNQQKIISEVAERRKRLRNQILEYKSTLKCVKCGESHISCLDFHHVDRGEKEICIAEAITNGWSIERIKKEIAKCIVVCRNCHAKIHWEE